MSYPTADSIILELVRERDRLLISLEEMYDAFNGDFDHDNIEYKALIKAKETLQRSGTNFDDDGDIIKY